MIRVRNLKKSFGPITAVNGVSFTVEIGEVLGFLRPNGAGKSTPIVCSKGVSASCRDLQAGSLRSPE
jgi:ABC-type multidrug transport system ATPase subunit